jgi:hypothetical protein
MDDYRTLYDRCERLAKAITDRARSVARDAGLSPDYPYAHAHNAMVSYQQGTPWKEVDYSLCRKILWLEKKTWRVFDLLRIANLRQTDRFFKESWHA